MKTYNYKPRSATTNYKRLIPFIDAVDKLEEHHFTFRSGKYMPLSIENLGYTFNGCPVYGMMHYYTQNGDLMRDPDMTFYVNRKHGLIVPMTFQQDGCPFTRYGTLYEKVFDSVTRYRPRLLSDLDTFLRTWSTNIIDQGFKPEQAFQKA